MAPQSNTRSLRMSPDPWTTFEPTDADLHDAQESEDMVYYYKIMELIDQYPVDVSSYDADFLENNLTRHKVLTEKQQAHILTMAARYLPADYHDWLSEE